MNDQNNKIDTETAMSIFKTWFLKNGYGLNGDNISLARQENTNNYIVKVNDNTFGKCFYLAKINRFIGLKVFNKAVETPTIQNFLIGKKIQVFR